MAPCTPFLKIRRTPYYARDKEKQVYLGCVPTPGLWEEHALRARFSNPLGSLVANSYQNRQTFSKFEGRVGEVHSLKSDRTLSRMR